MAIYNGTNVLARRLRMFRRDPNCYWCGVRTVLDAEGKPNHTTIDHLYSKLHPLRPTYHKAGSDRTAVLHVLACAQCNQARGIADELGRVFVPELESRREMAKLASAADGNEILTKYWAESSAKPATPKYIRVVSPPRLQLKPDKRALMPDDVRGFGWTDIFGDLRPRSWEEYCNNRNAFIGSAFEPPPKPVKPKRRPICTIGELLEHRFA